MAYITRQEYETAMKAEMGLNKNERIVLQYLIERLENIGANLYKVSQNLEGMKK